MPLKPLLFTLPLLLLSTGRNSSAYEDSATQHVFLGGELNSVSDQFLRSPVEGNLRMGVSGNRNSLGMQLALRNYTSERTTTTTTSQSSTTETREGKVGLGVFGLEYRYHFRSINDPTHSPFLSATASKIVLISYKETSSTQVNSPAKEPDIGGFSLSLAVGDEAPLGRLSVSGKIGGHYQSLTSKDSNNSGTFSSYTTKSEYSTLSLLTSLGLACRF